MSYAAGESRLLSPAVVRILPFATFMAFVVLSSLLAPPSGVAGAWDTRMVYAMRTAAVAALLILFWQRYAELALTGLRRCEWGKAVAAGFVVFVLWIALDQPWATIGDPVSFDPRNSSGGIDWVVTIPRLLGLVLVVPVMEELFWRSFIQRWIDSPQFLEVDPRAGSRRAFIVTAALFSLEHSMIPAGFLAGLVYGWLYLHSGNLWMPVIAHAVTNGLLGAWILSTASWHLW